MLYWKGDHYNRIRAIPNILTMIIIFLWGWLLSATALFYGDTQGTRPAGMAGAFSALADDGNTTLHNPAGFSGIQAITFNSMYADLFSQLHAKVYNGQSDRLGYNYLAMVWPLDSEAGSLGLSWNQFTSVFYQENTVSLSYGRYILSKPNISAGINLKFLNWGLTTNEFTSDPMYYPFDELGRSNATFDLGLVWEAYPNLKAAAVVQNILPADVGIDGQEIVPMVVTVGLAYKLVIALSAIDFINIATDHSIRAEQYEFEFGLESWFLNELVAVRTGMDSTQFSAGFSYCIKSAKQPIALQLDYAFSYPFYLQETIGSHRLSMNLEWQHKKVPIHSDSEVFLLEDYKKAVAAEVYGNNAEALQWWEKIRKQIPNSLAVQNQINSIPRDPSVRRSPKVSQVVKTKGGRIIRIRKIPGLDPKKEALAATISRFQLQMEDSPKALEVYINERLRMADDYYRKGHYALALNELENSRNLTENKYRIDAKIELIRNDVREKIGQAFKQGMEYVRLKQYLAALRQFEMILKIESSYQPARSKLMMVKIIINEQFQVKFESAIRQYEDGQYNEAMKGFKQIHENWPHYPNLNYYIEQTEVKLELLAKAPEMIEFAQQALEKHQIEAAIKRLLPLMNSKILVNQTQPLFQKVIYYKAKALRFYHRAQDVHVKKLYAQERELLVKSLVYDQNIEVREQLIVLLIRSGKALYRENRLAEALEYWNAILKIKPDHHLVKKYKQKTKDLLDKEK